MSSIFYSCQILTELGFWGRFKKNDQVSTIVTTRPVAIELFHAADERTDRQTDMTNLKVAFCNFYNAPEP
jgi:hypothetical protein